METNPAILELAGELEYGYLSPQRPYLKPPMNSCPISLLPSEILIEIFAYLMAHRSASIPFENIRPSYINFTYVCRDWRDLALNTPTLWTQPDFRWPVWAREMLRRSKGAPLHISYRHEDVGEEEFEATMTDVLAHTSRFASLFLRLDLWREEMGYDRFFQALDKPAPLLRSLHLSFCHTLHPHDIPFAENLFDHNTPSLRQLTLDGCHFVWTSPLLKNLTVFFLRTHVNAVTSPCSQCPSTKQFMEILEAMPQLEVLNVDSSLPSHLSVALDPSRAVHLSRMRDLRLVGSSVGDCANLLQRISFPPRGTLEVSCRPLEHENKAAPLFSALSHIFAQFTDSQTSFEKLQVSVSITGMDNPTIAFHAFNDIDASSSNVKIQLPIWGDSAVPLIQPALKAFPLASLQKLTFACDGFPTNCFLSCFGSLPNLRIIDLVQRDVVDFVCALQKGPDDCQNMSSPSSVLPFPALETLDMRDVDFRALFENDMLAKALKTRAEHGALLRNLSVKECLDVHQEDIDRFKELMEGVNVDWDGHYIPRLPEDEEDEEVFEGEWYEPQISDYESDE
ncbi:hypothetical protein L218DRAFT_1006593 [Marasmius fiardii PR-910]|nr:hypothetical protein L218DRAFT_1006593 [Marasmius fiardii PR-910]